MKANKLIAIALAVGVVSSAAHGADLGNLNPTGISGEFNGDITTGCSYDPYTGNARRSITDIIVAGGVSTYPLAFTRTMTSRYTAGLPCDFGPAGNWKHSFQWSIDMATVKQRGSAGVPKTYYVNYPDGRRIAFSSATGDVKFRGPKGVGDRFDQLTAPTDGALCHVILPDGGKIRFQATVVTTTSGSGANRKYTSVYTFRFVSIVDPYGQITTITYPPDGSTTVTEPGPAHRTLKLFYRTTTAAEGNPNDTVLFKVSGSDGRNVIYSYTAYVTPNNRRYTALSGVRYFDSFDATYTYQNGNVDPNDRPLIKTCVDPMYDGPMWRIAYTFATGTGAVQGQLRSENRLDGTNPGVAVSTLAVTNTNTRTETRGDNRTRTFTYTGYKLRSTTDFKGAGASQNYDSNGYVNSIADRNGHETTYNRHALTGNVTATTYPIPGDVQPANIATRIVQKYGGQDAADPNNRNSNMPYYLASIEDGEGHPSQTFYRDTSMRVTSIVYVAPSHGATVPSESFDYTPNGQLWHHVNRRGYTESYEYDGDRVMAYRDAAHANGNPTARYQYDPRGRVSSITDARDYTTRFEYNERGQLTRLIHPDGKYIQYAYNPNGTLAWTADERHPDADTHPEQRTSYTYDDYKRLRTVTTPLRSAGDTATPRTTAYSYDVPPNNEYVFVDANPTRIQSPGNKVTTMAYDENRRTTRVTAVGEGTNPPDATTTYTYDNVGNVTTVKDPNGQTTGAVTTYNWDEMNRINSIDDPLATGQGHTRRFRYDPAGHLIKEVRQDDKMKQYAYDKLGRCYWVLDFGSTWDLVENPPGSGCVNNCSTVNPIQYSYDNEDNVVWMSLPGAQFYDFLYDELNRKTRQTYPADYLGVPRTEQYHYDTANHLDQYINPAGQIKTLGYDSRGRLTSANWNAKGPNVSISYDDTRPTGFTTSAYTVPVPGGGNVNCPGTALIFGYDEANNRTYEEQSVGNSPVRRVQTDPDPDGSRKNLLVKTGGTVNFENDFDYTSRNELRNIKNSSLQPLFTYTYDANGNVTQRTGRTLTGDTTTTLYDRLNRPTQCTHSISGAVNFSVSTYHYSAIGNLTDVIRGSSSYEDGKGDYFNVYNESNELASALYSATSATDPNPAKSVSFDVVGRCRDAMTVTTPTGTERTNYFHNNYSINQYTNIRIGGIDHPLQHDDNLNLTDYNGWKYVYDAENRLVSVSGNNHSAQFAYDAVGRCLRRLIDNATTVFTYDQWTPIVEWDVNNNLAATNIYGLGDDEILYRSSGSTQWYYKSDPMGNVRFLLNGAGTVIEKYVYDAFGSPTITNFNGSSSTTNRFMFSGREYFSSLGLYDMRNRIYDPVMGRFYQTDPVGLASDPTNLYRFCGNNPLLGGDPMGLDGEDFSGDYGGDASFGGGEGWWYTGGTNSDGSIYGSFYMYQPSAAFSASYDSYLNDIFNTGTNAGISSWAGDSGNFLPADSYLPSYATAATHAPSRVSTSVASQGVGQPGLIGSFVPVYGSLRSSIDYFQTGHPFLGTLYAALTAVDVGTLGADSLITSGIKGAARGMNNPVVRAAVKRGLEAHAGYYAEKKAAGMITDTAIEGTRLRPDAVDFLNKVIYELKPNTPTGRTLGAKKLGRYKAALGEDFQTVLDLY